MQTWRNPSCNIDFLFKPTIVGTSKQILHQVFLLLISIVLAISGLGLNTQSRTVTASSITMTSVSDSGSGSLHAAIAKAADEAAGTYSGLGGAVYIGGTGLGSAIFNQGSLYLDSSVTLTSNTVTAGFAGAKLTTSEVDSGNAKKGKPVDASSGIFNNSGKNRSDVLYYPPTDISLSSNSVYENQAGGTTIGLFSSTDPDSGDTFTYTLVSGTGDTDNGKFWIMLGFLTTSFPLNYESTPLLSIRVRSTDSHNKYYEKSFTITVNDINEAPTGISLSKNSVIENMPAGAEVGSLSTVDEDTTNFTYSKVSDVSGCDGSDNNSFIIDHSNLITSVPFNYEGRTSYSVCIRTTENTPSALSYEKQFTINITNVNESPTELTGIANKVYETDPVGTVVFTLSTNDPDVGDTFTYSLVSGTGDTDNSSFEISGNTVITKVPLDFETQSNYAIRVRSTDSGGLIIEKAFVFEISDVNEPPTSISLSNNTIDENEAVNTVIGDLSSVDGDSSVFTFSLVSGSGSADNAAFSISGSHLILQVTPDYETKSEYKIRIRTTDSTDLFYEKSFTLNVLDVNEAPTVKTTPADQKFTSGKNFKFTIGTGTFIDDDGDSLTFSSTLASGDALPVWLNFDPTTLEYSGNSSRVQSLTIKLNADDGKGGVTSATFALNIVQVAGNHSPVVMNLIPNQKAEAGAAFGYSFTLKTFTDYDEDVLSYEAKLASGDELPTWLTFSPDSRLFSGTPGSGDVGSYLIHVDALDVKGGETYTEFSIGVDTNVSPSVITPIPNQNAFRGESWTFTFDEDTFEDADEDTLSYSADLSDGSALPTWLSFDPSSRTFTGTIPDDSSSNFVYDIRVTVNDGTHDVSDSFYLTPWLILDPKNNLYSGIKIGYEQSASSGPLTSPNSYSRWYDTAEIKLLYGSTTISNLDNEGIQVCFKLSESDSERVNGDLSKIVIGTSHNDSNWTILATTVDSGKMMICAFTNEFSLYDLFIKNANNLSTSSDQETSQTSSLPGTGFAPGWNGVLPVQETAYAYSTFNELTLKIPAIGVNTSILGVPQNDGQWDVTWLGDHIGWLEGSDFPTWVGNSVLTGHVWNADNQPGIFVDLKKLKYGDQIILHAWNQDYIYEVRDQKSVTPNSVSTVFTQKKDHSWLSLLTCSSYDEKTKTYTSRTLVRAVLIKVVGN